MGRGCNTVHDRHHHIQQNQVDFVVLHNIQRLLTGKGLIQVVAFRGQIDFQGVDDIRLIVTNQDIIHGASLFLH